MNLSVAHICINTCRAFQYPQGLIYHRSMLRRRWNCLIGLSFDRLLLRDLNMRFPRITLLLTPGTRTKAKLFTSQAFGMLPHRTGTEIVYVTTAVLRLFIKPATKKHLALFFCLQSSALSLWNFSIRLFLVWPKSSICPDGYIFSSKNNIQGGSGRRVVMRLRFS